MSCIVTFSGDPWPETSSGLLPIALLTLGTISRVPSLTALALFSAISLQLTHHCGLSSGSMTSLLRLQRPRRIGLSAVPRNSPLLLRNSTMETRA